MTLEWLAVATVIAAASFVMGLAGFGVALVAMAFLPFLMSPVTAVVLLTIYATVFALAIFIPVRRDFVPAGVVDLLVGTVLGTPLGVWVLATFPVAALNRLIGAVLVVVAVLEWVGVYPERLSGRWWALGAGLVAGIVGGAVGTPGPPAVLYATTQGWSPRTIKANLQAFFIVNQAVILAGYWWADLLTREAWRLAVEFAGPAAVGVALGMLLFNYVDQRRFRRIVFGLILFSGLALLVGG